MADVQLENGYSRIANEILEQLAKMPLNGTQFRIIMTVWRSTYGFNKKEHAISEAFLSKAIGVARPHVHRELKPLFDKKILTVIENPTFSRAAVIAFNKNYDEWQGVSNRQQVPDSVTGAVNDTGSGTELGTSTGTELGTQKRNNKTNTKQTCAFDDFFEDIWKMYPNKKGKSAVKLTRKKELYKLGYEKLSLAISRYKQEIKALDIQAQYIKHGSTFFNGAYEDYLSDDWTSPLQKGSLGSGGDIFDETGG